MKSVKLKEYKYKNILVGIDVYEDGTFVSYALDIFREYENNSSGIGFKDLLSAEIAIQNKIDEFLNTTPKTYSELAKSIESTLVWTGYEDCYVDEFILKTLVGNFLKVIS